MRLHLKIGPVCRSGSGLLIEPLTSNVELNFSPIKRNYIINAYILLAYVALTAILWGAAATV